MMEVWVQWLPRAELMGRGPAMSAGSPREFDARAKALILLASSPVLQKAETASA